MSQDMRKTLMNQFLSRTASTIWNSRCFSSPSIASLSNSKLFIGGLSSSVDHVHLIEAFSSFGDVTEAMVIYDKATGRSRGYGFVRFSEESSAGAAKDAMDGRALLGRPMMISFALERARGEGRVVVPRFSNAENRSKHNS